MMAMTTGGQPIAWLALEEGTQVVSSDGEEIGKVVRVVADVGKDIFSGVAIRTGLLEQTQFAPAALIEEITTEAVRLTVSAGEVDKLDAYSS